MQSKTNLFNLFAFIISCIFWNREHLPGPIFDLYSNPNRELQTGFLSGLTPGSNQQVCKLIAGRRFKKQIQRKF